MAGPCPKSRQVVWGDRTTEVKFEIIGVLLGCFGRKIDRDSWFTWWFNHLPGPTICPKRSPIFEMPFFVSTPLAFVAGSRDKSGGGG